MTSIGTTELNDGMDQYKYDRFDFHIDRFLGGIITKNTAILDYEKDVAWKQRAEQMKLPVVPIIEGV